MGSTVGSREGEGAAEWIGGQGEKAAGIHNIIGGTSMGWVVGRTNPCLSDRSKRQSRAGEGRVYSYDVDVGLTVCERRDSSQ